MKNPISPLIEYFRSARAELEKVTWPTRQETLRYSLLVVGVSAAMAGFFAALDFGLSQGIELALKRQATTQTAPPVAPVTPTTSELEDNLQPAVQGFDAQGNPVDITITPVNGDDQGGITITP
ncbi:preprotein translocase subunit SecE [Patescibacteria group bacterium]|jgi:preprotein translocase subunit SecE|nr:preprotein translocase subunit SecE [Patescibacteria group bacterium]